MVDEPQSRNADDLRLLYESSVTELVFFKSRQWTVTHYGFLLYAGLLATAEIGRWPHGWVRSVLFAATLAVGAAAIAFVRVGLQEAIRVRRRRLKAVRKRLTRPFRKAWRAGEKRDDAEDWVHVFLCGVLALGALITGILILAGPWRPAMLTLNDRELHLARAAPVVGRWSTL